MSATSARALMALSSCVFAAGCAPSVQLSKPRVELPVAFEPRSQGRAPTAIDRWWLSFQDLQLAALVNEALASGFDTRLGYARLVEARAVRSRALRDTGPTGNLAADYTRPYTSQLSSNFPNINLGGTGGEAGGIGDLFNPTGPINNYALSLNASWEIDLFGRLSAIRRQARQTFAAEALDFEATKVSVAADVATYVFQARGEAAQLANAQETRRISSELAASARLGVQRGLTAGGDAARLETDEANAEAEVIRFANALDITKRQILVLIGRGTAALATLPIAPHLESPPSPPEVVPSMLLARRADVRVAEMRLAAATTQVQIDRLALFPRIDLRPGTSFASTNSPLGATTIAWSIGAGLALPILDRPRMLATLRISQAQGEQAVIRYERAVQVAYQEADRALAAVIADRQRSAALNLAQARADYAFNAARTGYRIGVSDLTTLLQAEQAWRIARIAAINQRAQALRNVVTAFRALGGGWAPSPDPDATGPLLTSTRP